MKYEYIEMVKCKLENEHMAYLLSQPEEKGIFTKEEIKRFKRAL
jgi:hypothetical protein